MIRRNFLSSRGQPLWPRPLALGGLLVILLAACGHAAETPLILRSPDGGIVVMLQTGGRLSYAVQFQGKPVLGASPLGVTINGDDLGQEAASSGAAGTREIDERYPTRGVHSVAVNRCRVLTVPLQGGRSRRAWELEVRVFDDAVAYQYRVPAGGEEMHIDGESSAWNVPAGSTVWSQDVKNRSYESFFHPDEVGQMAVRTQVLAPATLQLPDGLGYGMITEANLVDYSDMDLEKTGPTTFQALFYDRPRGWTRRGDLTTPWRVLVLTRDLNALVNTDVIKNLCPPPPAELANAAWIRPGRSIWHWLTGRGPKLAEQPGWIDGAAALGFEYYLIDEGWRNWDGGGDKAWDALGEVVRYAKSKGVGIWAWELARAVTDAKARDAYFARAKALGVVGLKLDFPHAPDPEWVQWYDDVLSDAARHELMIDFHGAVKPTGRDRTWPHELTREAVAGREQGRNPAVHDTALPFSRYVQGHADYTPTLLQAGRLDGASFAHELAMAVLDPSEFLCLGDNPKSYLNSRAVDMIKALPSVWDETVVLPGSEIGKTAAFARRRGDEWFIAVLNGPEHDGTVPLTFLGPGTYKLVELADDPGRNDAFARSERTATSGDTLNFHLRKDGGYVAWLRKE